MTGFFMSISFYQIFKPSNPSSQYSNLTTHYPILKSLYPITRIFIKFASLENKK